MVTAPPSRPPSLPPSPPFPGRFDAHGHLNVKKGCSEKDFPADLPYFAKHDLNTAVKEHHHGGHHAHHRHEHK